MYCEQNVMIEKYNEGLYSERSFWVTTLEPGICDQINITITTVFKWVLLSKNNIL